jgi:hypothetical protein
MDEELMAFSLTALADKPELAQLADWEAPEQLAPLCY